MSTTTLAGKRKKKAAAEVAPETAPVAAPVPEVIACIKGFDADLKCRGYQFEVGKSYTHDGDVVACQSGFHAIEGNPLEVFEYYAPGVNRYADVSVSGKLARHTGDSKIAAAEITIKAELRIPDLVTRAVKWVIDHAKSVPENHATGDQSAASATGDQSAASATGYQSAASATGDQSAASATGYRSAASATGDQSAASATGDRSAASATGDRSAASATGDRSAASATGYRSAASATGDRSAASATGYRSAASATGDRSAAMACGYEGRVSGIKGNALFLTERNSNYDIIAVWAGIVGKDGIEPDVFYMLRDGKPVPAGGQS